MRHHVARRPCPFCGYERSKIVYQQRAGPRVFVECYACGGRGPVTTNGRNAGRAWGNVLDVSPKRIPIALQIP